MVIKVHESNFCCILTPLLGPAFLAMRRRCTFATTIFLSNLYLFDVWIDKLPDCDEQ